MTYLCLGRTNGCWPPEPGMNRGLERMEKMDSRPEILATTQLPPEPASAGRARRFVRDVLRQEGPTVDVEVVALLTSEVVTNAVLHAGTDVDLVVRSEGGCIRVEA